MAREVHRSVLTVFRVSVYNTRTLIYKRRRIINRVLCARRHGRFCDYFATVWCLLHKTLPADLLCLTVNIFDSERLGWVLLEKRTHSFPKDCSIPLDWHRRTLYSHRGTPHCKNYQGGSEMWVNTTLRKALFQFMIQTLLTLLTNCIKISIKFQEQSLIVIWNFILILMQFVKRVNNVCISSGS